MEDREQEREYGSILNNPSWMNCSRERQPQKYLWLLQSDILQDSLGMFPVACKCLGAGEKVTPLPARGDRQTAAQTIGSLSRNLGKIADPEAAFP